METPSENTTKNKPFIPKAPDNRKVEEENENNNGSDSDPNYSYFPTGAYPDLDPKTDASESNPGPDGNEEPKTPSSL